MLYASVSTGFKAGGFFATGDNAVIDNSYKPEEITAYAIGSKNRFGSDRIQLNAEAFFWDYTDHQESYLAPIESAVPGVRLHHDQRAGGGDLRSRRGFHRVLTDNDQLAIKAQYLHAEYTDFVFSTARPGEFQPPPNGSPGTQPPADGVRRRRS